jgi:hypothetical protein
VSPKQTGEPSTARRVGCASRPNRAAIRNGAASPVTADEGARTLAVLDAARRSAAENRSIIL